MRLLAVLLIAFAMSLPALANGSPCGAPPKLENAEAARAITAAVRSDLGAAPLETSFLDQARQTVDDLVAKHDLSRAAVVARYMYHICEALYARGTDGAQLSQVLSRVQQALSQAGAAEEAATAPVTDGEAMAENGADAPARSEGPKATVEDAEPVATELLEAPARESGVERQARRLQYRAAPREPGNNAGINQFAAPQNRGMTMQRSAPRVGGGTAAPRTASPEATEAAPQPKAVAPEVVEQPRIAADSEPARAPATAGREDAPRPTPTVDEMAEPAPLAETTVAETGPGGPAAEAEAVSAEPETAAQEMAAQEMAASEPAPAPAAETDTATTAADAEPGGPAAAQPAPETTNALAGATATTRAPPDQAACPDRGVLGPECFDVDAALESLRDRPVEYNHPPQMIKGQATEITLALRTDFTQEGLPEEASEAFEGLQGEVKQQRAKIANIMSARLRGRDFEVDPKGMQERTVTWRRPVEWSWYVTPKAGGEDKRLELELYAHIVNPQGETQPPVLIKTLDATIDVDVRTLDWLVEQAKTFEPIYAVAAAIIGFFTALITLWFRRRPAHPGDAPPSGITTAPTPPQRRVSDMSAGEAAAEAARKGQDEDDNGKGRG